MSAEHKAALAAGRAQGRAVRRYLEAAQAQKRKRGRKRAPEAIEARLARIESELESADALKRLHLLQERHDLQRELGTGIAPEKLRELEKDFVEAALPYGKRKGITYAAWRACGVDAAVLKRAGITRST